MIDQFIKDMNQRLPLGAEEKQAIRESLRIRSYAKGDWILEEGSISKAFYYNLSGFVRLFYVRNGEERTAYFYPEGTFISAYQSFVRQEAAAFSLQATEETQLVEISQEAAGQLLACSPKFEVLARMAMEDELMANQKMISSLLTLNPEERYHQFLQESPEIIQRIPQHYLASYIGVQPESLSRIKRRLLKR